MAGRNDLGAAIFGSRRMREQHGGQKQAQAEASFHIMHPPTNRSSHDALRSLSGIYSAVIA
jgi:hypothetical protein